MVHIADVLGRRHVPAAGLFLSLTRRCPLSCAHCSTNSTIHSEEHPAEPFLRLARSFTPRSRPEFLFLTGGEALLRLSTVREIIGIAQRCDIRTVLISGLFFARKRAVVPDRIAGVLRAVDHVVVSHDQFHAPEVPRSHALEVVARLLRDGVDVSFQLVAAGPDDPYLAETVTAIRERFGDRVPALVAPLGSTGRGASLFDAAPAAPLPAAGAGLTGPGRLAKVPCVMAAWPVVSYDGTIVACCSQDIVDGPAPDHLILGHAGRDRWEIIAERCRTRAALRAIRVYGPQALTERYQPGCGSGGYCATCRRISERPAVRTGAGELAAAPSFAAMETLMELSHSVGGAEAFARAHGVPEFADMVTLGHRRSAAVGMPAGGIR